MPVKKPAEEMPYVVRIESMPQITAKDALQFEVTRQRGQVLRGAESLLDEVQAFVAALRSKDVPSAGLNPFSFSRVMTDHAALLAKMEALKVVEST